MFWVNLDKDGSYIEFKQDIKWSDEIELAAKKLCEEASEGPWENMYHRAHVTCKDWRAYMPLIADCVPKKSQDLDAQFHNADFITASRTLLPAAIKEIERLRNKLNKDSQNFEIECLKAQNNLLREKNATNSCNCRKKCGK